MQRRIGLLTGALLLFFLAVFGAAYSYSAKQHTGVLVDRNASLTSSRTMSTESPIASVSASASAHPLVPAGTVVDRFYKWYTKCTGSCDYKTSVDVDIQKLGDNIDSKFASGNPIMCGQNPPASVRLDRTIDQTNDMSAAYVVEDFGGGNQKQILVDLEVIGSAWKIVNISCPR